MRENMKDKSLSPIHPGEVLFEDFMKPLGLSQYRLANDIDEFFVFACNLD